MTPDPASGQSTATGAFDPQLRRLRLGDVGHWLALGLRDFVRVPRIGLFYGACFAAMGWALMTLFERAPVHVLTLSAGFLLVGPFLCMGLYRVSQQLEAGHEPTLWDSLLAWKAHTGALGIFGFALLVLEMLWARTALVIFAVTFNGMPDFKGSIMKLVDAQNLGFMVAYVAAGAVFAGLIFALSVISIPMILDRPVDAITAALTSLRLVIAQPLLMLAWGAVITALVVLALLPWFMGLLVVGPVLGHATWHAYRAAVMPARAG